LPVGGVALLRATSALDTLPAYDDQRVGVCVVCRPVEASVRQIAEPLVRKVDCGGKLKEERRFAVRLECSFWPALSAGASMDCDAV